jgi:hypothetical protein
VRHRDVYGPTGSPATDCDGRMVAAGDGSPLAICARCLVAARIQESLGVSLTMAWRRPGRWISKVEREEGRRQ